MNEKNDMGSPEDVNEATETMLCVHCGTPTRYSEDSLLCDRCFFDMWSNPDGYQDDADSWEETLRKRAARKTHGPKAP